MKSMFRGFLSAIFLVIFLFLIFGEAEAFMAPAKLPFNLEGSVQAPFLHGSPVQGIVVSINYTMMRDTQFYEPMIQVVEGDRVMKNANMLELSSLSSKGDMVIQRGLKAMKCPLWANRQGMILHLREINITRIRC